MNESFLVSLLAGVLLLLSGRKLFWFFVGAVGFLAGLTFAPRLFQEQPGWVLLVIALGAGLLGAILALVLQRFAVAVAGFFAGGYLATALLTSLNVDLGSLSWLPYLIVGGIGAVLVSVLFDWALILLSSLTGAMLITQALSLAQPLSTVVFLILALVGIGIQAGMLRREGTVRERQENGARVEDV